MSLTNIQLEQRQTGIGGSETAAILGISPYDTPITIWRRKRGLEPPKEQSEAMRWGNVLEPLVLQRYEQEQGIQVISPDMTFRHPSLPQMIANVDGLAFSGKRVVEVKTTRNGRNWGEPLSEEIPVYHWIQVQHYLAVTQAELADVAVLIAGSDFRIYRVVPNREFQERMMAAIIEFWRHVESGEEPMPLTEEECRQRWPQSVVKSIRADEGTKQAYEELLVARQTTKAAEEKESFWRTKIEQAMQDADTLMSEDNRVLCTWRTARDSERIDSDRLRAERPDIAEQFTKTVRGGRRFLVKE